MADPLRQPIIRELEAQGWTFTLTRNNHVRGHHPEASAPLVVAGTTSDHRAVLNIRSQAKRLLRKKEDR